MLVPTLGVEKRKKPLLQVIASWSIPAGLERASEGWESLGRRLPGMVKLSRQRHCQKQAEAGNAEYCPPSSKPSLEQYNITQGSEEHLNLKFGEIVMNKP